MIRDLNPAAERMFGYGRDDLLGEEIEILVPDRLRSVHVEERAGYMARPHPRPMGIGLELWGRRRDGSEFPVEISLSPMNTHEGTHVIAIVADQTERRRLRAFGVSALSAAEEERQRIARELHDDTAQRLAALLMRMQLMGRARTPAERDASLAEVRQGVEEAANSVRRIAQNLRPPVLDEVGVVGAIRAHARSLREAYGLEIEVEAPHSEPRLPQHLELALYRVVQEALSNVVRHAGSPRASVSIAVLGHVVDITVVDEGRGFDAEAVEREERGLGLLGMRERVRNAGGRLEIESAPGAGTRVRIQFPLEGPRA